MSYRTRDFVWRPCTTTDWATFTADRREAARPWGDLVVHHRRLRRLGWRWPGEARWQCWAKGRYPGISAQCARQIIGELCEAVDSRRHLRKNCQTAARYAWHRPHYHDVVYPNQDARIRDGRLLLRRGTSGTLRIRLPDAIALPRRLMEVRLSFGMVRLICEVTDVPRPQQTVIGVDLGVNTLIAATDGAKVFLVNGRAVKAVIQWRSKTLARLQQAQPGTTKGSRHWKRRQPRTSQLLGKTKRQVRNGTHRATHAIAEAVASATCEIGKPCHDTAQRTTRVHAQPVSTACTRTLIERVDYKTAGALVVNESYASQTRPVCGERSKRWRIYHCPHCGATSPRDAVGAVKILALGHHGALLPGRPLASPTAPTAQWFGRTPRTSLG